MKKNNVVVVNSENLINVKIHKMTFEESLEITKKLLQKKAKKANQ